MWHVYAYVPAVANVLVTDTFALLPAMSAGAPACCVKNTLCGTEPKANVTASPTFTVSVAGVNVSDGVAATGLSGSCKNVAGCGSPGTAWRSHRGAGFVRVAARTSVSSNRRIFARARRDRFLEDERLTDYVRDGRSSPADHSERPIAVHRRRWSRDATRQHARDDHEPVPRLARRPPGSRQERRRGRRRRRRGSALPVAQRGHAAADARGEGSHRASGNSRSPR